MNVSKKLVIDSINECKSINEKDILADMIDEEIYDFFADLSYRYNIIIDYSGFNWRFEDE